MTRVSHVRMGINLEWIFMPFIKLEKFESVIIAHMMRAWNMNHMN